LNSKQEKGHLTEAPNSDCKALRLKEDGL